MNLGFFKLLCKFYVRTAKVRRQKIWLNTYVDLESAYVHISLQDELGDDIVFEEGILEDPEEEAIHAYLRDEKVEEWPVDPYDDTSPNYPDILIYHKVDSDLSHLIYRDQEKIGKFNDFIASLLDSQSWAEPYNRDNTKGQYDRIDMVVLFLPTKKDTIIDLGLAMDDRYYTLEESGEDGYLIRPREDGDLRRSKIPKFKQLFEYLKIFDGQEMTSKEMYALQAKQRPTYIIAAGGHEYYYTADVNLIAQLHKGIEHLVGWTFADYGYLQSP